MTTEDPGTNDVTVERPNDVSGTSLQSPLSEESRDLSRRGDIVTAGLLHHLSRLGYKIPIKDDTVAEYCDKN